MVRLIDADALVHDLIHNRSFYPVCVRRAIEDAPIIDAVPVVRCKDCRHWEEIKHGYGWCCASTPNHALTKDDDFCSYGERRTDATD